MFGRADLSSLSCWAVSPPRGLVSTRALPRNAGERDTPSHTVQNCVFRRVLFFGGSPRLCLLWRLRGFRHAELPAEKRDPNTPERGLERQAVKNLNASSIVFISVGRLPWRFFFFGWFRHFAREFDSTKAQPRHTPRDTPRGTVKKCDCVFRRVFFFRWFAVDLSLKGFCRGTLERERDRDTHRATQCRIWLCLPSGLFF